MNPAAPAALAVLVLAAPPAWYLEAPLSALGGDLDAMLADPHGGVWAAVTGETTAAGRARVLYLAPGAAAWREVYAGPTATDLSLHSAGPGALYLGFNQPLRAFEPALLRLDGERVTPLPAPAERLDALEFLQVGDYALRSDDEGWACGQHGALWRLEAGAWIREPSPFPWKPGDSHQTSYCVALELLGPAEGLMVTADGRGARWDGRAWRPIDAPPGRRIFPRSGGLAREEAGFFRFTAGGWVALADACAELDAPALAGRLVIDRSGAVGVTRDAVIDFGAAAWSCRPSRAEFGLRAVASRGGALWALSDDGIRREAAERVVTFAPAADASLPPGLQYPLPVDLDLDGDADVIAALADAAVLPSTATAHGALALWENLGDGAFRRAAGLPALELRIFPRQLAVGDLDGDADLDLATVDARGRVQVWRRDGASYAEAGAWRGTPGTWLFLVDLEGDGDLDVVARELALLGDGAGTFTPGELPPIAVHSAPWLDVDGDGDADTVAFRWRDPAVLVRNEGDAGFRELPLPVVAEAGTFADLDLDGAPELLAQRLHYYHLALPFRRCRLGPTLACDESDRDTTPAGVVADLDADGRPDIITGSLRVDETPPRSGEVHLGRAGGFSDVTYASGLLPHPTPFDADGDGDLDVYTRDGGLALQRGAPAAWLRVRPRAAAGDRLASGSWVVVRDADERVVASGRAEAGVLLLGLPDPLARYRVTVRFPGGASRTLLDVPARSDLEVYDRDGAARATALLRLWAAGTWTRLHPWRDVLAPLAALALALALMGRTPRARAWRGAFAAAALGAWPAWLGLTARRPGALAWSLAPLVLASAGLLTVLVAALVAARRRTRAGPFRLRERLGAGAAGTVWRAERGGEDLALKLYDADTMTSADARERFFREARVGAEIQHPNLVQIVDAGRLDDGRCFLAMKRIDGRSLAALLAEGPLPVARALEVAADVAAALGALHRAGIVHRDVKPDNIVLRRDGRAVLTDLGLARGALFRTVTRAEVAVGTLAYMSPEQAIGRPLDGRADLWSLGVVLYELLTGARPFDGAHELALIFAVCNHDPPDPRARRPELSPALCAELLGCLARDPERRPPDADALHAALLRLRAAL